MPRSKALPGNPVAFATTPSPRAYVVDYGTACKVGLTRLGAGMGPTGFPLIGNTRFSLALWGGLSVRPVILMLGFSDDTFGPFRLPLKLPGICPLYTSVDLVIATTTDAYGRVVQNVPIPNDPRLKGGIFFAQWAQPVSLEVATSSAAAVQVF